MAHVFIWIATAGLIGWVTVYTACFIGVILHYLARARQTNQPVSIRSFLKHCFPREVLSSRWTWLDLIVMALNKLMFAFVFDSVAGMVALLASFFQVCLVGIFGASPGMGVNGFTFTLFLICGLLVRDFASFFIHMLQHRIPILWEFHKVHHAPESLVPFSTNRLHPLDQIVGMAAEAPLLGLIVGFYGWFTDQGLASIILSSVGFYVVVNILTFAPLRHSHIDLRLGWLEIFLLSPAHHRLHHSAEPEHWDKNFSAIFPFWDRFARTLFSPPPAETYRLGLPEGKSMLYSTLLGCYVEPFRSILQRLKTEGWWVLIRPGKLFNRPQMFLASKWRLGRGLITTERL